MTDVQKNKKCKGKDNKELVIKSVVQFDFSNLTMQIHVLQTCNYTAVYILHIGILCCQTIYGACEVGKVNVDLYIASS